MSFLEIKNTTKTFDKQVALRDVSINVEKGELVCILGPSGCGKTTLLRIIAGLEASDSGSVWIGGRDCTYLPPAKRNFGIVFQSYALFPNMTVRQNILFGLQQKKGMTKTDMQVKTGEVLRMVDLMEHKDKYPAQLSGGQQQRTALARAIALSPAYLLLDEPLSALDAKVRMKLRGEICRIQKTLGITTVMVTHDQDEALTMADKIIVMNNAVVEQVGTPREIYDHPASPFVARFIGTMNFYDRDGQTCAIRPENITLCSRSEDYDLIARVKEIEFKGALSRITGVLDRQQEIYIDVPTEVVDRMKLHVNASVFLKMPPRSLVVYPVPEAV